MTIRQAIFRALLAGAAVAKPLDNVYAVKARSSGIEWGPCAFNGSLPIVCGTLAVPLDYTDPLSNKTLNLELSKVPAKNTPSKGSILLNFGGPGYEAVETLGAEAALLQNTTGGNHDLIAFNPRGTGNTLTFSCYANDTERTLATYKYPFVQNDLSDAALGQSWASATAITNICGEKRKDIGGLVGTAFVARDMMQIVDALAEDGYLRFWGLSYGSLLGATIAAMFPDRVDRIILDGNVNAHNYYHKDTIDVDQMLSAEKTLLRTLDECIKSGDRCALSQINSTALELQTTLVKTANELIDAPLVIDDFVLTHDLFLNLLYLGIKYTGSFPAVMTQLYNIITRTNLEGLIDFSNKLASGVSMGSEAGQGIKCSDTFPRASELSEVMYEIQYMIQANPIFGGLTSLNTMMCAQWPFEAKERYSGDFKVKTHHPMLLIQNTYDPATSMQSARVMNSDFEGSVLLEQRGFGHTSISQVSACSWGIISNYFNNGTLPNPGTVCEVDGALFP